MAVVFTLWLQCLHHGCSVCIMAVVFTLWLLCLYHVCSVYIMAAVFTSCLQFLHYACSVYIMALVFKLRLQCLHHGCSVCIMSVFLHYGCSVYIISVVFSLWLQCLHYVYRVRITAAVFTSWLQCLHRGCSVYIMAVEFTLWLQYYIMAVVLHCGCSVYIMAAVFASCLQLYIIAAVFTSWLQCFHDGCSVYIMSVAFTSWLQCLHHVCSVYIVAVVFTSWLQCLLQGLHHGCSVTSWLELVSRLVFRAPSTTRDYIRAERGWSVCIMTEVFTSRLLCLHHGCTSLQRAVGLLGIEIIIFSCVYQHTLLPFRGLLGFQELPFSVLFISILYFPLEGCWASRNRNCHFLFLFINMLYFPLEGCWASGNKNCHFLLFINILYCPLEGCWVSRNRNCHFPLCLSIYFIPFGGLLGFQKQKLSFSPQFINIPSLPLEGFLFSINRNVLFSCVYQYTALQRAFGLLEMEIVIFPSVHQYTSLQMAFWLLEIEIIIFACVYQYALLPFRRLLGFQKQKWSFSPLFFSILYFPLEVCWASRNRNCHFLLCLSIYFTSLWRAVGLLEIKIVIFYCVDQYTLLPFRGLFGFQKQKLSFSPLFINKLNIHCLFVFVCCFCLFVFGEVFGDLLCLSFNHVSS